MEAGLSVVVKRKDGKIVGACLNFDARSKESAPLCAVSAFSRNNVQNELSSENVNEKEVPMTVVEFLDAVEEPLKDEHIPQALGKTIYASLLGTAADLSASENVKVRVYLVTYYFCLLESGFKRLIFFLLLS